MQFDLPKENLYLFIELEEFLIDHFHIPGTLQNTQNLLRK